MHIESGAGFLLSLSTLRRFGKLHASCNKVKSTSCQFKHKLATTTSFPRAFPSAQLRLKDTAFCPKTTLMCTASGRGSARAALGLRIALDQLEVSFQADDCASTIHSHSL